jgi:hypothetical protein
METRVSI